MVVAPVEPIIPDQFDPVKTGPGDWTRDGAALKVPAAAGDLVHEQSARFAGEAVEIGRDSGDGQLRTEGADRTVIRAEDDGDGQGAETVEHECFAEEEFVWVGPGGAAGLHAQHEGAGLQSGLGVAQHGGGVLHLRLPVAGRIAGGVAGRSGKQGAGGLFGFPEAEGQFVGRDEFELAPGQRPGDSKAADLLPKRTGLLIAHEKVLIVDARQPEG